MRSLPVPDRTEDFTADPVELFFDLAYVFAFSQLVGRLLEDHTWGGVARTALLFFLVWLPWTTFSWSTNAVPGNNRSVRALVLVATHDPSSPLSRLVVRVVDSACGSHHGRSTRSRARVDRLARTVQLPCTSSRGADRLQ